MSSVIKEGGSLTCRLKGSYIEKQRVRAPQLHSLISDSFHFLTGLNFCYTETFLNVAPNQVSFHSAGGQRTF